MSTQLVLPNRVCPNDEILISLARGEISEPALGHYLTHLESCLDCCRRSMDLEKNLPNPLVHLVRQVPRESPINLPDPLWKNHFLLVAHPQTSDLSRGLNLESKEFAGFQLESILGEGRSGIVYRAYDPVVRRRVALKVLRPDIAQRPEMVATFLEEARALASVRDPHVVTLHSFGRDPMPHITMDLLEGPTLSQLLAEGPIELERTLRIIRDVALGLEALHAAFLVHRDIKPNNIRIEPGKKGEKAVLLDLGLAGEGNRRAGTPGYMAPEILRQGKPTPASDIYSLGILFRILLTNSTVKRNLLGQKPQPVNALKTGGEILVFPSQVKMVPEPITRLLNEMLDYQPEARPSAQDVVARLDRFLATPQTPRRFFWTGLAAAALLIGFFGFILSQKPSTKFLVIDPIQGELGFPGIVPDWTLGPMSPANIKDIFQIDASGWLLRPMEDGLLLSRFEENEPNIVIPTPHGLTRAALRYPYLATCQRDRSLMFWDVSTLPPKILAQAQLPHYSPFVFAWSENDDDSLLFCSGLDQNLVTLLEVRGEEVIPLTPPQNLEAPSAKHPPMRGYWQPGKKRITTTMPLGGMASFDLFHKDDQAEPRFAFRFMQHDGPLGVSWNPDGNRLIAFNEIGEVAFLKDEIVQNGNVFPYAKVLKTWNLKMPVDQLKWVNESEIVLLKRLDEPKGLPLFEIGENSEFPELPKTLFQTGPSPFVAISTQPKAGLVAAMARDGSVRIWKWPQEKK